MSLRTIGLLAVFGVLVGGAGVARAEYVSDEVHLDFREGPGTEFRIIRLLETGDEVRVVEKSDGWIRVALPGGPEGWIRDGYLGADPPARSRVDRAERERDEAQARANELASKLESHKAAVGDIDALRARVAQLELENARLNVEFGWQLLVAGAVIILSGILLGAYMTRKGTRTARIRFSS